MALTTRFRWPNKSLPSAKTYFWPSKMATRTVFTMPRTRKRCSRRSGCAMTSFRRPAMDKPKYKPENALIQAIGFTEDDLEANRKGHLTEAQSARLRSSQSKNLAIVFLGVLGFLPAPWLCAASVINGVQPDLRWSVVLAVGCAALWVTSLQKWDLYRHDRDEGEVELVEGAVRVDTWEQMFSSRNILA